MVNKQQGAHSSGAYVGGALLILIGLAALAANLGGDRYIYESIPLAIGVAFFIGYGATRQYGLLVPAGILTGLGAGVLASSLFNAAGNDAATFVVDGIGVGFLSIYAIDILVAKRATRWWPVIPGGLMVVIGSGASLTNQQVTEQAGIWLPVLLIVLGVAILLTRVRRRTS